MEKKVPNIRNYKLIIYLISIVLFFLLGYSYGVFKNEKLSKEKLAKIFYEEPALFSDVFLKMQELKKNNDSAKTSKIILDLKESLLKDNDFFLGNPKGEKVIIEFFDYNCGYCKRNFTELMELILEDKEIKIILKEFPILGESSLLASKAAIASKKQGKYFEMHQKLLSQKSRIDLKKIKELANEIDINVEMLIHDMEKESNLKIIKENKILAEKIGVDGTPTFIIGQEVIPGSIGKEDFIDSLANL